MTATQVQRVTSFAPLRPDVADILGHINYATMTTVGRKGRPRSRVLIAVWELDGDRPVGWLATFKTPVKAAHIAHNPHVTTSYWSPRQDVVSIASPSGSTIRRSSTGSESCTAVAARRASATTRSASGPPGRTGPDFHVLRLEPWRVQVLRGRELTAGTPPRIWQTPA